jgi:mannosyltransferase OCH1-like enzyme
MLWIVYFIGKIFVYYNYMQITEIVPTQPVGFPEIVPTALAQPVGFPKIIHQTWKNNIVPPHWQSSQDMWKKYHPDWQYILWTDDMNRNFIRDNFPMLLSTFDNFPYNIQRADMIRYAILYKFGGVYCDLDLEPMSNLEDLFPNKGVYLVQSKNTPSYITNSFMASSPNDPFWLKVLEECSKPPKWWWIGKHLYVMNTTGPMMISKVYYDSGITINLLPLSLFSCGVCSKMPCKSINSRLVSLQGSSWIQFDTTFYNFFLCNWKYIILLLIILVCAYIIYYQRSLQQCTIKLNKCMKH